MDHQIVHRHGQICQVLIAFGGLKGGQEDINKAFLCLDKFQAM